MNYIIKRIWLFFLGLFIVFMAGILIAAVHLVKIVKNVGAGS